MYWENKAFIDTARHHVLPLPSHPIFHELLDELPDLFPVRADFNYYTRQLAIRVANYGKKSAGPSLTGVNIPQCGWKPLIPTPVIEPGRAAEILSPPIPSRVCGLIPGHNIYNIWITVNADNKIQESNKRNNTLYKEIRPYTY